jgi:hypothetical protein
MTGVMAVLTAEGRDRVLAQGGVQQFRIANWRATQLAGAYCVLFQTRNHGTAEWDFAAAAASAAPHGEAFLVGRILRIERSIDDPERRRIVLGEYALPPATAARWDGSRFPVRYFDSLANLNIAEAALAWQPMKPTIGFWEPLPGGPNQRPLNPTERRENYKIVAGILTNAERLVRYATEALQQLNLDQPVQLPREDHIDDLTAGIKSRFGWLRYLGRARTESAAP